jgi:hypothetical protein
MTEQDRTIIFFWQFGVSAIGQHFDLSICEVLELQKTVGGILEHSFCLVRLMDSINLNCECY